MEVIKKIEKEFENRNKETYKVFLEIYKDENGKECFRYWGKYNPTVCFENDCITVEKPIISFSYEEVSVPCEHISKFIKMKTCTSIYARDKENRKTISQVISTDDELFQEMWNILSANDKVDVNALKRSGSVDRCMRWLTAVILIIVAIIFLMNIDWSGSQSKWDSLSDEEKEWYKDNYGDGQYDDIKDAIDEYKENNKPY